MADVPASTAKQHWKAGYRAAVARQQQGETPRRERTQTRFGRAMSTTGTPDGHIKRLAGTETGRRRRFRKKASQTSGRPLPAPDVAAATIEAAVGNVDDDDDDDDDDEMLLVPLVESGARGDGARRGTSPHQRHKHVDHGQNNNNSNKWRALAYRVLSGRSRLRGAVVFNRTLAVLVLLNVAAFIAESVEEIEQAGRPFFYVFEAVSSVVFLLEHIARVWSIPESKSYSRYSSAARARLRYSVSLPAILDLASCLPFFIELGQANKDLPTLSWLKAFRMFRISKNEAVFRAFSSVYRVVWYNAEILAVALLMAAMLMVATSTLLWYLQPAKNANTTTTMHLAAHGPRTCIHSGGVGEAPPPDSQDDFSSIPATFYLAVLMLTGQGTPAGVLPWYTKIIVIVTAIFSVPIFVIPAGMLTWGFEAEAERLMRKRRERRRKAKVAVAAGERVASSSSSSSDASDDSVDAGGGVGGVGIWLTEDEDDVWDEYEAVVLGSDDDGAGGGGNARGGAAMIAEDRVLLAKVISLLSAKSGSVSGSGSGSGSGDGSVSGAGGLWSASPLPAVRGGASETAASAAAAAMHVQPASAELGALQEQVHRLESKLDSLTALMAKVAAQR